MTDRRPLGTGVTRSHRLTLSDGSRTERAVWKVIDEYRPHAALQALDSLRSELEAYLIRRIESARLRAGDVRVIREVLRATTIALVPFAPHLAEEVWERLGERPFVVQARWPSG